MAQRSQFCTTCGALLQTGQKFCTNCGTTMGENVNGPTQLASNTVPNNSPGIPLPPPPAAAGQVFAPPPPGTAYTLPSGGGNASTPPPPPFSTFNSYPNSTPGTPYPNSTPGIPTFSDGPGRAAGNAIPSDNFRQAPGYNAQAAPITNAPVPTYAQKPKRSNGCLLTSLVLLLILAAGIGGFIVVHSHFSGGTSANTNSPGGTSANANGTTTQGSNVISVEQLNLSVTYASIALIVQSVQEAKSFSDDTDTSTPIVVRVNLQETNTTPNSGNYAEANSLFLILPDGSSMQANNDQNPIGPASGIKRTTWLDFGLNNQVTLNQLILRIGAQDQNQMNIPLQPGANVSKYQDTITQLNKTFQYAGLGWTLKTATLSYSYDNQQATTGNRYVIIALASTNQTSNGFSGAPNDYIRLQTAGSSIAPDSDYTFPISVDANANASGIIAFLVPQDASSFTLVMEAQQTDPPITQTTVPFQSN